MMKLPKIFTLLVIMTLSGCVVTSNRPIDVTMERLQLLRVSPFDQRFKLTLAINNKSSQALYVRRLNYSVMLSNLEITSGQEDVWKSVPAFSTQKIEIFFSTNIWGQLGPIFAIVKEERQLNYHLTGELSTGSLLYQQISYIHYTSALTKDQLPMKKLQKLQKLIPNLGF